MDWVEEQGLDIYSLGMMQDMRIVTLVCYNTSQSFRHE